MRIVIKVGTSTLAHKTGLLNIKRAEKMCKVISDLKNAGHEIVLVSSGAIGMGLGKLGLTKRPDDVSTCQAAAAIGQSELMYTYDKLFSEYNHTVAQILITGAFVTIEDYGKNLNNTLFRLLEQGVIPIVIANRVNADLLIILSDIDGFFTGDPNTDPNAERISVVEEVTDELEALAGKPGSRLGTGGMVTKIKAAKLVTENGIEMVIANGKDPDIMYDILEGNAICTRFLPKK